ncbi:Peptidase M20 domain-containing protein 2 [Talaromyces pinophilus]|nr:Peptidase M20 domain-containing protein 2 [Talaromyces pinophilus]
MSGHVHLIGIPAEEGGGGKLKLTDADGCPGFAGDAFLPTTANRKLTVKYTGRSAHGTVAPWDVVNALDAVVLAYNGISILRQQIKPAKEFMVS